MNALPKTLPHLPRYTSYPTAPHFNRQQAGDAQSLLYAKAKSNAASVYIHIPFCDRLCWFCGCHTKHTLKYEPIVKYVETVAQEINQFAQRNKTRTKLVALHFGGGSPSILKPKEAALLKCALQTAFDFAMDAEISVEVDPNDASDEMLETFSILGMTRASLGVQDFNPVVQAAINRPQSFEETRDLIEALRGKNITSLNIDALYGLPFQTTNSLKDTINQVISLKPDRIALFGYAHVPSLKKHQNMIKSSSLPDDDERVKQAMVARVEILKAGYEAVGLDHFASKTDALTIAKSNGTLHRNFQGYTTDQANLLLGFGASSISSSSGAYLQNTVATGNYMRLVKEAKSVAERGFVLSQDDQIRAFIIKSIMCNFRINIQELTEHFGDSAANYHAEIENTARNDLYGLCEFKNGVLEILPGRQDYVRLVASQFDAYLNHGGATYSKAV